MTTKDKVLEALKTGSNEYVSGSQIASHLNISRNAVWKAIEQLRADGYKIIAVTHKGYKLVAVSDKPVPDIISRYLKESGVPSHSLAPIYFYHTIEAVNAAAKQLVSDGTPHGTSVIAAALNSAYIEENGYSDLVSDNLNMSIVLFPDQRNSITTPQLTRMCVVAVYELLEEVAGITCEIRDVDSLFYKGEKICEIYTEGAGMMKGGVRTITTNILSILIFTRDLSLNRSLLSAKILKRLIYDKPDIQSTEARYREYSKKQK